MFRKLLVASMLTLSLSACAPADAASSFDYSSTFKATDGYFNECNANIRAMVGVEVTNGMVAKADKACAYAIAGSLILTSQEGGTPAFARWLADHPKEGSIVNIERWNETSRMVGALVEFAGPENLPYLARVAEALNARGQDLSL